MSAQYKIAEAFIQFATKGYKETIGAMREAAAVFGTVKDKTQTVVEAQRDMMAQGQKIRDAFLNPVEQLNKRMSVLSALVRGGAIDWETYRRALSAAMGEYKKQTAVKPLPPPEPPKLTGTQKDYSSGIDRGLSLTKEFRTPLEVLQNKMGELNKLLKNGAINWTTYGRAGADALARYKSTLPAQQTLMQKLMGGVGKAGGAASAAGFGGMGQALGVVAKLAGPIALLVAGLVVAAKAAKGLIGFLKEAFVVASSFSAKWQVNSERLSARFEQLLATIGKPLVEAMQPFLVALEKAVSITERLIRQFNSLGRGLLAPLKIFLHSLVSGLLAVERILEKMGLLAEATTAARQTAATYTGLEDFSKNLQAGVNKTDPTIALQEKSNGWLEKLSTACELILQQIAGKHTANPPAFGK